jgi:TonB-linked SusC/RagA family outer membrane protein
MGCKKINKTQNKMNNTFNPMKYILLLKICFCIAFIFITINVYAQQKEYKGIVKEENGEGFSGVNVMIKGTKTVAITDKNGLFSIIASEGETLVFSFIGYKTMEVPLMLNTNLTVILSAESKELDELIVIGYGYEKKSDLTAAISSVKSKDLIRTSITSVDQGLQGRAAGVVVVNTSGQPGGATSIRIRGTSSVMGTNEPLYVIDGVPIVNGGTSSGAFSSPSLNPMAMLNPNDVESMEILKDASATAIYGARGANGVILITTKRGSKGKIKTAFSAYYGIQHISKTIGMLNAVQLAELGNEATDNAGIDRNPIYANINNLRKNTTDWQREIFRVAPIQNYEISFSGGGEKSAYFLSGNYFSQDGIILGSDYQKGSLRFNLDQEISNRIKIGTTVNVSYNGSHGVVTNTESAFASSITSWALEMNPGLPVRKPDGTYVYENNTSKPAVGNPVQDAHEYQQLTKSARLIGNFYGDVKILESLHFKSSIGVDYYDVKEQNFTPNNIKRGETNNGAANVGHTEGYTWIWENTMTFNKYLTEKHHINVLAGITVQQYVSENTLVATSDFEDNRLGYHSIQTGAKRQLASTSYSGWQMLSYLARVNYSFNNRYLLTMTGRIDGSSKFGVNNKYGFFPSSAFAWKVIEEDFMKNIRTFNNLKLRLSYGVVGNEGIPPYSSQGLLLPTESYVGTDKIIKGQAPWSLDNSELKWESTAQFNAGIDAGMYNNRISLTADFYLKKTNDLLLYVPTPVHTGYDAAMQNVGSLENRGFEFSINVVPVTGKSFLWESNITFGYNRNKVIDLVGSQEGLSGNSIMGINYWTKITEGKPIGTIYGYKTDGIVQLDENLATIPYFPGRNINYGDRKYVNKNPEVDNVLNEDDLFELGNANPDFTYSWSNTFSYNFGYKGGALHLTLYLQGVYGNEIANFNLFSLESFDGSKNNSTVALQRWTPANPTNAYPRVTANPPSQVFSDHQVEDGSYLRVKDLTLAWDLPQAWCRKIPGALFQLYVSAKNMFTFTNYSGYDPEVSRFGANNLSMGADYGAYPVSKMVMIGLKANF